MKGFRGLLIVVLILVLIIMTTVACNRDEKNTGKDLTSNDKTDNNDKTGIENGTNTKDEEAIDYKTLYLEEFNSLIDRFGKYDDSESGNAVKGVKYGDLIDFDGDGIPEMLVAHDSRVLLYRIENGEVKSIYDERAGDRYLGREIFSISINRDTDPPCLIVYRSEHILAEDRAEILTVKNGEIQKQEICARVRDGVEDEDTVEEEEFENFSIDGETVTEEEYYEIYNSLVKDAEDIDLTYSQEPATKDNLEDFIKLLEEK